MIRYSLKCSQDHRFDSWFASSAGYDALHASGHVTCPECGTKRVEKALMAPQVGADTATPKAKGTGADAALSVPAKAPHEQALARLREIVERESEYVGPGFATEARKMHAGDAPERAIYGEARLDEARALIEDGVPITPLPFLPRRKTN